MSDYLRLLHRRAFTTGDPSLIQLWFDATVIDRYRAQTDFQVIRTNTAGRVRKQGGWAIDCGIADDDRTLHCSWSAIAALPDSEREHWAAHAIAVGGVSENFLRMQLSPGSCFDDGDLRTW
jgi:hypothetical protein